MTANIRPARGSALILLAWLIITLLAWVARGGDITKGYTFTPTDRVTSTKLNGIVDDAVINSTFITGKSVGTPDASDSMVFYSAGSSGLRKATLSSLFLQNSAIITGQTEDTSPVTGDFVLTYDVSATALRKATLLNLVFTNAALLPSRTNWPTPARTTTAVLGYDSASGEWFKMSRSNLMYQFFEFNTWTNQPTNATPGTLDAIPIFDYAAGTNKLTTPLAVLTNWPTIPTNVATEVMLTMSNGVPRWMPMTSLRTNFATSGVFLTTNLTYVSTAVALSSISGAGVVINEAHGLGQAPLFLRAEMVCTTADNGYVVGDKVDLAFPHNLSSTSPGNLWCNATNVGFTAFGAAANWQMYNKTTGDSVTPTAARWEIRVLARP